MEPAADSTAAPANAAAPAAEPATTAASGTPPVVTAGTTSGQSIALVSSPAAGDAATPAVALADVGLVIAARHKAGDSRFELRLDPPELGLIEVRLDVDKDGTVRSHLIVDRPATLDLLQRDARQLERTLQSAGLDTAKGGLEFSLRDQSQTFQQNAERDAWQGARRERLTAVDEPLSDPRAATYGRLLASAGGLDIRV